MTLGFASPWLLWLLALVPVLYLLSRWAGRRPRPPALRYADTSLTMTGARPWRLTALGLMTPLRLLVLALMIFALARPQSGQALEFVTGEGVDIALALDISGSMGTLDLGTQDRLEAAKEAIGSFIDERRHDRIGLVVFAESAFLQSPPTLDHDVLSRQVTEVGLARAIGIPDGTAIGLGLANAANMLKDSDSASKVMILLTDGVNNSGELDPLTAATAAAALGIRVYTIGVGRPGLVPVRRGSEGQIVYQQSELDEESLRQIADITGARYFRATDEDSLENIYEEINQLEKSEFEVFSFSRNQELAAWLLVPALALLLVEMSSVRTFLRRIP